MEAGVDTLLKQQDVDGQSVTRQEALLLELFQHIEKHKVP